MLGTDHNNVETLILSNKHIELQTSDTKKRIISFISNLTENKSPQHGQQRVSTLHVVHTENVVT
jgi:hypothetical protein